MVQFRSLCVLMCLVSITVSCATGIDTKKSNIEVTSADPDRIRFQGKGSAAGFMLSGSMGPMGIAIGVAIDEGIAKEIQASADAAGFDIKSLVQSAYHDANTVCKITGIDLKRYGFKMKRGSDDMVVANIDSIVHYESMEPKEVNYPISSVDNLILREVSLDDLKTKGQLVDELLRDALNDVFKRAC